LVFAAERNKPVFAEEARMVAFNVWRVDLRGIDLDFDGLAVR
jgi:hypothetical protein